MLIKVLSKYICEGLLKDKTIYTSQGHGLIPSGNDLNRAKVEQDPWYHKVALGHNELSC